MTSGDANNDAKGNAPQLPADYVTRAEAFGFASPADVASAMKATNVVVLDVRTKDEIEENGKLEPPPSAAVKYDYVHSNCTPMQCPELESMAEKLLPDKEATIVIHCASGKRAAKAQETLKEQGYRRVLNAGGLQDLQAVLA